MNLNAPDDVAQLYAVIDSWTRDMPWHRSTRADHFETTYSSASAKKVRVYLHKSFAKDEAAAPWEIARQIKSAVNAARRFHQGKDGHRRTRPGKRARERERAHRAADATPGDHRQ